MDPKQLLLIGAGTAVVGGGATGAYFLISEKKETTVSTKDTSKEVKKPSLKESLTDLSFLNTTNDEHKDTWGKLIDKFHELGSSNTSKINAAIVAKTDNPDNKDENIKILKEACNNLLAKTDFQESDKNIAKDWCSSNTTLLTAARPGSSVVP